MSGLPTASHASPELTGSDLKTGPERATGISNTLALDLNKAGEYARAEKAPGTRKAYRSDFAIFRAWASAREASPIPADPETVAAFLASEAASGVRASTLGRRLAAIRYAHKLAGHPVPSDDERVRATMRGIRRSLGTATTKKTPATAERLIAMAGTNTTRLADLRDRALLLLGFGGALRRSEIVALNVEDIARTQEGLRVTIRHSKTDQEAAGAVIAILRGSVACPWKPYRRGCLSRRSTAGRYSGRCERMAKYRHGGSLIGACRISSKPMHCASGSTLRSTPVTPCGPALSPRQQDVEPRCSS
jgi:integrase